MRNLHCPICASKIDWKINNFNCSAGGSFSAQLGNAIKNAVYGVDPASHAPRKPSLAPYLWCPSCTTELEDYDDRQKKLKCSVCSLKLPATTYFELMEVKKYHSELDIDEE